MKRILGKGVLMILMGVVWLGNSHAQTTTDGVCTGRLRVKFNEATLPQGISEKKSNTGNWSMDYRNRKVRVYRMERVFPYNARTEARTRYAGLHLWYDLWYEEVKIGTKAAENSVALPEMQVVEPVYQVRKAGQKTLGSGVPLADLEPDDFYWNNLWNLNSSFLGGNKVKFSDLNVQEAWRITTGSPEVIVAVMDSGIDYDHEDLQGNIWINREEIPGDGIDNDGNGYIDDVYGVNVVKKVSADVNWNKPIDKGWHGTFCAGIIAARTSNGKGISGIAGGWGDVPGVKVMCCQILASGNEFANADTPAAFYYAANQGAVISSNSWEVDGNPQTISQATKEGIDYFVKYAGTDPEDPTGETQAAGSPMKGGIVFFAAGNGNKATNAWPAMYEKVLAVSNITKQLTKADNSNYGDWVAFAAPGTEIRSTYYGDNRDYYMASGSSMACPHVAGVAALALSRFGGLGYTAAQLEEKLRAATHDIDAYNPEYIGQLGRFIDAGMAVTVDEKKAPAQVTDLAVTEVAENELTLSWKLTQDEDDSYVARCRLYYSESPLSAAALEGVDYVEVNTRDKNIGETIVRKLKLRSGVAYYFGVVEYDRWGNRSVLSNIVRGNLLLADGFAVGQREARVEWLGTSGISAWTVRWKAGNETEYKKAVVNSSAYNVNLLEPDTEYTLEVVEEEDQVIFRKTFRTEALAGDFAVIRIPEDEFVAGESYWPVVRNIQITPKGIVWKVDGKVVDSSQNLSFEAGKHELRAEVTLADGITEVLIREIVVQSK